MYLCFTNEIFYYITIIYDLYIYSHIQYRIVTFVANRNNTTEESTRKVGHDRSFLPRLSVE